MNYSEGDVGKVNVLLGEVIVQKISVGLCSHNNCIHEYVCHHNK